MIDFRDRDQTVLFKFNNIVSIHLDPIPRPYSRHEISAWREDDREPPLQYLSMSIEIPNASLLLYYETPESRQSDYDRMLNHMRTL